MQPATKNFKFDQENEEEEEDVNEGIQGDVKDSFMDEQLYASSSGWSFYWCCCVVSVVLVQRLTEKFRSGDLPDPNSWQRINITPDQIPNDETKQVCHELSQCLNLREKWLFSPQPPPPGQGPNTRPFDPFYMKKMVGLKMSMELKDGVFFVYDEDDEKKEKPFWAAPPIDEYYKDLRKLMNVVENGPCKTFCFGRLALLESRFNMHLLLNEFTELAACKQVPKRDIYNVRKVDTHIHHSAIMNSKHLLKFIKKKLKTEKDETVLQRDGKYLTLQQVFDR